MVASTPMQAASQWLDPKSDAIDLNSAIKSKLPAHLIRFPLILRLEFLHKVYGIIWPAERILPKSRFFDPWRGAGTRGGFIN